MSQLHCNSFCKVCGQDVVVALYAVHGLDASVQALRVWLIFGNELPHDVAFVAIAFVAIAFVAIAFVAMRPPGGGGGAADRRRASCARRRTGELGARASGGGHEVLAASAESFGGRESEGFRGDGRRVASHMYNGVEGSKLTALAARQRCAPDLHASLKKCKLAKFRILNFSQHAQRASP
jgi:hypothetical protein